MRVDLQFTENQYSADTSLLEDMRKISQKARQLYVEAFYLRLEMQKNINNHTPTPTPIHTHQGHYSRPIAALELA